MTKHHDKLILVLNLLSNCLSKCRQNSSIFVPIVIGISRNLVESQRYTQLIGCESALRRLDHFAESLSADIKRLARGIHLLSNFSDPFRAVLFFSSFRSGVRSSKEYSRYRSNINYVRTKQVNNPKSFCSMRSFREEARHRVAYIRAAQRSSRRELHRGRPGGMGFRPLT